MAHKLLIIILTCVFLTTDGFVQTRNISEYDDSMNDTEDLIRLLDEFRNSYDYQIIIAMKIYLLPLIIAFGTVGNVASLIVFARWPVAQTATYFYMSALALADLSVLYVSGLRKWIELVTKVDVRNNSVVMCKLGSFLPSWCLHFSVWTLVAMTADRFMAVHWPLWTVRISTVANGRKVMAMVAAVLVVFNMPLLWKMTLIHDRCLSFDEQYLLVIHPWIDAILYSILPTFLIAILNVLILKDLSAAGKPTTNLTSRNHRFRGVNLMLLLVSFAFIVFTLPACVLFIVREYAYEPSDFQHLLSFLRIEASTTMLMYLNHSCNFLLYCISGAKFREILTGMLCFRSGSARPRFSVTESTNMSDVSRRNRVSTVSDNFTLHETHRKLSTVN